MWVADVNPDGVLPGCLCTSRDAVWWVSASGLLYTWAAGSDPDDEVTDPTMVAQVDRFAEGLAVSQDGTRAVIASSACVSVLSIRYLESVCFLQMADDGDEDAAPGTAREFVPAAQEVARLPCALGEVRHIALSISADDDAARLVAAICTDAGLCVMGGLPEDAWYGDDEGGAPLAHLEDSMYLTNFTCTEVGASTVGGVLACFIGARQLLVVDEVNHLLLLLVNEAAGEDGSGDGGAEATVRLLVDGHICSRTARVTAVACGHSGVLGEAIVAVGFSNGAVHLLNGSTLQPLRRWSVREALGAGPQDPYAAAAGGGERVRRLSHLSARARLGIPEPQEASAGLAAEAAATPMVVFDVRIGTHFISVGTSSGILYYSRQTLQPEADHTHLFTPPLCKPGDSVPATLAAVGMRLASNGRWVYTDYAEGVVHFSPHDVDTQHTLATHAAAAAAATNDVVHAQSPLPAAWLRQPSTPLYDTSRGAGAKAAAPGTRGRGQATATAASRRAPARGSGYGEAPWSVQQERKRRAKAAAARDRAAQAFGAVSAASAAAAANPVRFAYDFDQLFGVGRRALVTLGSATDALQRLHARAVSEVVFATAGDALISAGTDGRVQHLQFPVARSKRTDILVGCVLPGHSGGVTALDANLSRQNTLLVTGGADGFLRMWAPGSRETPVVECAVGLGSDKERRSATAPVTTAQFFYLDKFALSCAGGALELRRCDLLGAPSPTEGAVAAASEAGTLARARVYRYAVGEGHTITAATAVNHFTSNLVFLATSEKEVQVVDVAADAVLWREGGTHSRGVYRVATGRTSRYAGGTDVGSDAAHLFMSASLDSTAVLWDVRVAKPAQLFTQHVNTAIPSLALEFSPASAVVAVGSQDNAVYLYDLRGGRGAIALDVLRGFSAYPTSLAWHPLRPVLAVGLSDGDVHILQQTP